MGVHHDFIKTIALPLRDPSIPLRSTQDDTSTTSFQLKAESGRIS